MTEDSRLTRRGPNTRFVVDRGVHGVFALSTSGEFPMLEPTSARLSSVSSMRWATRCR